MLSSFLRINIYKKAQQKQQQQQQYIGDGKFRFYIYFWEKKNKENFFFTLFLHPIYTSFMNEWATNMPVWIGILRYYNHVAKLNNDVEKTG